LLLSKEKEIDMRSSKTIELQKKISRQSLLNNAKEHELKEVRKELIRANSLLERHQRESLKIRTRLDEIKNIISTKTRNALDNIERGMRLSEVKQVAGKPRMTTKYVYGKLLNYGRVVAHIENGVVACITKASCEVEWKCVDYEFSKARSSSCILK